MGGYIINFTVYTMAMLGLISFAVFVYKKITDGSMHSSRAKFLCVEDSLSINPRKSLQVIRAGKEKFLIASDIDRTTLIAKLGVNESIEKNNLDRFKDIPLETIEDVDSVAKQAVDTYKLTPLESVQTKPKRKVIHLEEINLKQAELNKQRLDRKSGRNRNINRKQVVEQNTNYEVENSQVKGFSTMKSMARRINEL